MSSDELCDQRGPKTLDDLPPLPEPKRVEQRRQERTGGVIVLGTCAVLIAVTVTASENFPGASKWTCRSFILVQALLATQFWLVLLLGNPGVVNRSPEACFPVPHHVLSGNVAENVRDGRRSFCVRCFVWRDLDQGDKDVAAPGSWSSWSMSCWSSRLYKFAKLPKTAHHCQICQRCVMYFDHHCSVLGRCVGSGNLASFCGLISMGMLGSFTAAISIGIAVLISWDDVRRQPWILVSVSIFFLFCCCQRPMLYCLRKLQCCCGSLCLRQAHDATPVAFGAM
ncbi:PFA4 [Symbiodinium natans]|uniref:Palmitoyltransferase n=1 Tax=Symbiodinium natans TaxID=878477 RepID=A0A812K3G7_9DINO|nr:PFA4 [Symbiodinium natans]